MSRPIAFVDTETDGLHPQRRAWEVAIIRRDPDGTRQEWRAFLPLDLRHADPMALQIGRFWDRHPSGRKVSGKEPCPSDSAVMSAHEAAKQIMRLTFGATIVGAVPSFDTDVLSRLLRSEGYLPSWHHRLRCVETLTAGHLRIEAGGLADCALAVGLSYDPTALHTAMGDARLAEQVYDRVMGGAS